MASRKKKTKKRKGKKKKQQLAPPKPQRKRRTSTLSTRDLMALGKKELIQKCKKSKLPYTGTKKEMASRILTQIKKSKENNLWLQKLNGMSALQSTQLIINGFVHLFSNRKYHMYADIVSLIAQFTNLVLVRFDLCYKKYRDIFTENGTMITRKNMNYVSQGRIKAATFMIGCSMGYNIGIHKWKIKILNEKSSTSDWIGITTNNKLCKKENVNIFSQKYKNVSYMLLGGRYVRSVNCPRAKANYDNYHGGGYYWNAPVYHAIRDHSIAGLSKWKNGDIVAFTLDCIKWKFKIYLNDMKLKTLNIKENTVYYAAIGSSSNNTCYRVLSFD